MSVVCGLRWRTVELNTAVFFKPVIIVLMTTESNPLHSASERLFLTFAWAFKFSARRWSSGCSLWSESTRPCYPSSLETFSHHIVEQPAVEMTDVQIATAALILIPMTEKHEQSLEHEQSLMSSQIYYRRFGH
jgi:hypothetical protein